MLFIENIDDCNFRMHGSNIHSGVKILGKNGLIAKAQHPAAGGVYEKISIFSIQKEEKILNHKSVNEISLNGTIHLTAEAFVDAFNTMIAQCCCGATVNTTTEEDCYFWILTDIANDGRLTYFDVLYCDYTTEIISLINGQSLVICASDVIVFSPSRGTAVNTYSPCATTTTEPPCEYEGVLTVGFDENVYGYIIEGMGGFGDINPLDVNIVAILWEQVDFFGEEGVLVIALSECYEEITLYINGVPYVFEAIGLMPPGAYVYVSPAPVNPFPVVGGTYNIALCYGDPCTTTSSTEEPGETTTSTEPETGTTTTGEPHSTTTSTEPEAGTTTTEEPHSTTTSTEGELVTTTSGEFVSTTTEPEAGTTTTEEPHSATTTTEEEVITTTEEPYVTTTTSEECVFPAFYFVPADLVDTTDLTSYNAISKYWGFSDYWRVGDFVYNEDTCDLIPTGYYAVQVPGQDYRIIYIVNGVIVSYSDFTPGTITNKDETKLILTKSGKFVTLKT